MNALGPIYMTPYGEYEPTNLILLLSDNPQSPPLDTLDSRNKEPASNANPIEGIPMMKSHDIFSFVSFYIKKTFVSGSKGLLLLLLSTTEFKFRRGL